MGIKFIGQFLIERGYITNEQLLDALGEQDDARLGALALAKGILLEGELEEALRVQQYEDARLGEIAVKHNMMSQAQLDYLLGLQKNDRRLLGQVLVAKGHMTQEVFNQALAEFDADAGEMHRVEPQYLPARHAGRKDMVAFVGMTAKMLQRIGSLPVKLEEAVEYRGPPTPLAYNVEISLSGDYGVGRYILSSDAQLARALTQRMTGVAAPIASDDEIHDALGELCNYIAGGSTAALAGLGHRVSLSPPQAITPKAPARSIEMGLRWMLHTPDGRAVVVME